MKPYLVVELMLKLILMVYAFGITTQVRQLRYKNPKTILYGLEIQL